MEQMEAITAVLRRKNRIIMNWKRWSNADAPFSSIYRYGERFDELTVQQVLRSIHQWEDDIRRELMYTRLSKAFLAYAMKANPTE